MKRSMSTQSSLLNFFHKKNNQRELDSVENVLSLVDETVKMPRLIGQSIHRNNIPADSPEQYYKRSIFLPFLDYFKNQLKERFIKHNNIIFGLQNLLPCYLIKLNTSSNELKNCIDFYKSFLPTYDTFESELKVWMEKWKSVPDKELPKSAIDTLSAMSKDLYPIIWCLLSILATLPQCQLRQQNVLFQL
ncbi:Hypothetical protein CINCED_3A023931 [Cinara cedri]|uniref:Uncharacterized protein n=1 Tax=Cinara cedri TaxID=506608 RepID=A0A5E4NED2_9HEMI|nr:Hypothetical protein CINCED_3A023931 [Cinara cedri]